MEQMSVTCTRCGWSGWMPAAMAGIKGSKEYERLKAKGFEPEPYCCPNCGKIMTMEDLD